MSEKIKFQCYEELNYVKNYAPKNEEKMEIKDIKKKPITPI